MSNLKHIRNASSTDLALIGKLITGLERLRCFCLYEGRLVRGDQVSFRDEPRVTNEHIDLACTQWLRNRKMGSSTE